MSYDFINHIRRQREFSLLTFGPGKRTKAVLDHIRKEIEEILEAEERGEPTLPEWVDLVLLAIDGAHRSGEDSEVPYTEEEVVAAIAAKLQVNLHRDWPDWRTVEADKAIEHVRDK